MPESKPRTVEFVGMPSDDGDFHFIVDRDTFETVAGREPESDEQVSRGKYRLYPQFWAGALRGKRKVKVKLSVSPI